MSPPASTVRYGTGMVPVISIGPAQISPRPKRKEVIQYSQQLLFLRVAEDIMMWCSRVRVAVPSLSRQLSSRLSRDARRWTKCIAASNTSQVRSLSSAIDKPLVPGIGLGKTSTGLVSFLCPAYMAVLVSCYLLQRLYHTPQLTAQYCFSIPTTGRTAGGSRRSPQNNRGKSSPPRQNRRFRHARNCSVSY